MRYIVATAVLLLASCSVAAAQDHGVSDPSVEGITPRSELLWLATSEGRIGGRAYISPVSSDQPALVIVLHGDLLQPDSPYHYGFARTVASRMSNVVSVGLLRPGYSDDLGNRSDGDMLNATGDNYTAEVVKAVAAATSQIKGRYDAEATVLVGHSGGAAIAALVLGRHPGVADAALLVSCPCDLPAWRAHMMSVRPNPVWERPHQGLSPLDSVSGVSATAIVELVVGAEDDVVRPQYSLDYAAALQEHAVEADVAILPSSDHDILHHPAVIDTMHELLERIRTRLRG